MGVTCITGIVLHLPVSSISMGDLVAKLIWAWPWKASGEVISVVSFNFLPASWNCSGLWPQPGKFHLSLLGLPKWSVPQRAHRIHETVSANQDLKQDDKTVKHGRRQHHFDSSKFTSSNLSLELTWFYSYRLTGVARMCTPLWAKSSRIRIDWSLP